MTDRNGLFFVFEGIDGSGKSTLAKSLYKRLESDGIPCELLKEPTDGEYGQELRSLLSGEITPPVKLQLELFLKDRAEDCKNNILPALEEGKVILLDRYYFSNAAYQGGDAFPPETIMRMNLEKDFPEPDRVYYLNISPEEALERVSDRINAGNIPRECFEDLNFLRKVAGIYEKIRTDLFLDVNATDSKEQIEQYVLKDIRQFLYEKKN